MKRSCLVTTEDTSQPCAESRSKESSEDRRCCSPGVLLTQEGYKGKEAWSSSLVLTESGGLGQLVWLKPSQNSLHH